jgi:sugar/nucleoside kinase (ribokinase family)
VSVVDVIVAGHLCLDMHPEMDHVALNTLASPGRLFETGALTLATGGAVSNTGLSLYRLGVDVGLMANIGDDFIGQAITNILASHHPGLNQYVKVLSGQPSSYTIVLTPGRSDRIFLHCTGPNATFGATDVDFDLLREAKIFHLGYPSLLPRLFAENGDELLAILKGAKAAGVVTSMDMTLPDPNSPSGQVDWRVIFPRVLPYADIFIPSIEEIVFCLRRADYDSWTGDVLTHLTADYLSDLADELIRMGGVIVGFKLGQFGFYIKTASAEHFDRLGRLQLNREKWADKMVWSPAYQVDVVGTTGAGDSAYAGFLGALLRSMSPDEAVKWACAVGACNVEASDSLSGVPDWEDIQVRLQAGWPTRSERLSGFL